MSINTNFILEYLETYNEHELFYQKYTEASKDPEVFSKFLSSLDPDYVKSNYLVVPELQNATLRTDIPMKENWYFRDVVSEIPASHKNVYLSKHNRFTPPFLHTHNFFECIYVLKGSCEHHIFGKNTRLEEGDLCLISPSVQHSIYADGNCLVINILIRMSNLEDIFFNVLRDHNIISDFLINSLYLNTFANCLTFHTADDEDIRQGILEMYMEQINGNEFCDRIISSMLVIFFTRLARKYKRTAVVSSQPQTNASSAQLLHYITDEYATITLAELASRLNYSIPYCSKYIKEATGYTFTQLLKYVRFQKAENYLLSTSYSIQRISELLGYENPENFVRAFKKEYHCSPSQFRLAHE